MDLDKKLLKVKIKVLIIPITQSKIDADEKV